MLDGWEVENGKDPEKKNIYLTPIEKIGYLTAISIFVFLTSFFTNEYRIRKKTIKKLQLVFDLQH